MSFNEDVEKFKNSFNKEHHFFYGAVVAEKMSDRKSTVNTILGKSGYEFVSLYDFCNRKFIIDVFDNKLSSCGLDIETKSNSINERGYYIDDWGRCVDLETGEIISKETGEIISKGTGYYYINDSGDYVDAETGEIISKGTGNYYIDDSGDYVDAETGEIISKGTRKYYIDNWDHYVDAETDEIISKGTGNYYIDDSGDYVDAETGEIISKETASNFVDKWSCERSHMDDILPHEIAYDDENSADMKVIPKTTTLRETIYVIYDLAYSPGEKNDHDEDLNYKLALEYLDDISLVKNIIFCDTKAVVESFLNQTPSIKKYVYENYIDADEEFDIDVCVEAILKSINIAAQKYYKTKSLNGKKALKNLVNDCRNFLGLDKESLITYISTAYNTKEVESLRNKVSNNIQSKEKSWDDIVGMAELKKQISDFENLVIFHKRVHSEGIQVGMQHLHMLFSGNPGTGKTMVARLMAKYLYDAGLVKYNKLIEVDRKDLVGQYQGHTARKTSSVINRAMGGVLFIDEAYSLILEDGGRDDFGHECVDTLITALENYKDNLVVIFAGYEKEMQRFLGANPGLNSRIPYRFHFSDYSSEELVEIFRRKMTGLGYKLEEEVLEKVKEACEIKSKIPEFGNGRFVDRYIQLTIQNHANNCKDRNEDLTLITIKDVPKLNDFETKVSAEGKAVPKIEDMIGMKSIKLQLKKFMDRCHFEQVIDTILAKGNSHMLFVGNPGTGKTMMARIIANELYCCGFIHSNKVIECAASELIGESEKDTANRVESLVKRALNGILFIDEAYSLNKSYLGNTAVTALIKYMEDYRESLLVIFAGYKWHMQQFLEINLGMRSRIGQTFEFDDYTDEEIIEICKQKLQKNSFRFDDNHTVEILEQLSEVVGFFTSMPDYGNGRFAEKLANLIIEKHIGNCTAIITEKGCEKSNYTEAELQALHIITQKDIPETSEIAAIMDNKDNFVTPDKITEEDYKSTAYHELGHAVIIRKKFPRRLVKLIKINPQADGTLGHVSFGTAETQCSYTASDIKNEITVILGGVAAENLFLSGTRNGCFDDLQKATRLAFDMVTRYGMSEYGLAVNLAKLEDMDSDVRTVVNNILNECLREAENILKDCEEQIQKLFNVLMDKKELSQAEMDSILFGCNGTIVLQDIIIKIIDEYKSEDTDDNTMSVSKWLPKLKSKLAIFLGKDAVKTFNGKQLLYPWLIEQGYLDFLQPENNLVVSDDGEPVEMYEASSFEITTIGKELGIMVEARGNLNDKSFRKGILVFTNNARLSIVERLAELLEFYQKKALK